MTDIKSIFVDKEYTIMSEIIDNENVTQRALSKKLGISVSTVNTLINKMIRDGLIKMTQVSQKQVFYMLTPIGMMEKTKKTVTYLKVHYRTIYETKEKIKSIIAELNQEHDVIFVLLDDDEMGEIMGIALDEIDKIPVKSKIQLIVKNEKLDIKGFDLPVLVHMSKQEEVLNEYKGIKGLKMVDLIEKL
ncbi:winged helix-turn-helix transcriptional regulator [Fusibacter ferrireducens]|uniref:Winged helix-turn-helix transcriptional regulator n=1 Tax=Fusibacter ferrireducens TaxID=2785058 RepID=A0ABR9ZYV7_9FIRM|nr:winged helix-turn-helix transcriptional regulator [Fusibacter ferrireducens]MBF4695146.1 winged helix-turn-helix transcriptional regulator [Fusibacter ferrireducens]